MNILIDFMERHPDFARDHSVNSPELWEVLLSLLHRAEGATKNERSWRKVNNPTFLF